MMPVSPDIRNWNTKATANSMGVAKRILPPHMVASQLKILMPVGTAMIMVESVKKAFATEVMPTVNIWCAHTPSEMNTIPTEAATMAGYPNMALRENTGMTSLATPNAGSTRM